MSSDPKPREGREQSSPDDTLGSVASGRQTQNPARGREPCWTWVEDVTVVGSSDPKPQRDENSGT